MAKGASLTDPAAGGFLDDVDVEITSSITGPYSYPGGTMVNALIVKMKTDDGTEHEEAYSSGAATPTDDGSGFETTPKDNSKAKRFIMSCVELGVKVGADVGIFKGLRLHVKRVALPKMPGIDKEGDRDKTVLLATKLLGAGPKGKVTSASSAKPTTTTASAAPTASAPPAATNGEPSDLDALAAEAIITILATAPNNSIGRLKLGTAVMITLAKAKDPNMANIKKLATDAAWLKANAEPGGWTFENDTVSIG